jgi:hypothetical protein
MFRVTITVGLVLGAVWMFLEGNQFSGDPRDVPAWLVGIPPWVVGVVCLGAAAVAAFIPAETVEELVERFLSGGAGGNVRR